MPKKKKPVIEMTTEELAKHVFPPQLYAKLKEVAHQGEAGKKLHESSQKKSIT